MLEVRGLSVAYGRHKALENVSISIAPGEIVVILGANGAGKTTLLKAIAGLVPAAASSQVRLEGKPLTNLPPHRIVEAGLALVPEGRGIFGDLSVRENLLLGAYAHRAREQQQQHLDRLLNLFPRLAERASQQARTMSGGEQQMVAIGRAMMSSPSILMLDEPSLGLSPLLCTELFRSLREIRQTGVGILLVEQNARQGLALADRAYLLENGHIVGEGQARAMAEDPAVQAAYLGGAGAAGAPPGPETVHAERAPVAGPGLAAAGVPHAVTGAAAAAHMGAGPPAMAGGATVTAAPSNLPATAATIDAAVDRALAAVGAARGAGPYPAPTAAAGLARSTRAESLVPMRIGDLVQMAAQVQTDHVRASRSAREHAPPTPTRAGATAAPAWDTGGGSMSEALARIEAAAANARAGTGTGPTSGSRAATQPRPATASRASAQDRGTGGSARQPGSDADSEPVPVIEVYRRPGRPGRPASEAAGRIEVYRAPKIEIYRRSKQTGELQRIDGE
ncbi:MAG: ATP-binding cassette domain-containing protein [Burkholderiales bacterium]|nr:MAG: ATP-binding cassette domain-containing protein [Burkholderiales bacterium]